MISANGSLPAHRYTPQVTQRWPRGSEPASVSVGNFAILAFVDPIGIVTTPSGMKIFESQ